MNIHYMILFPTGSAYIHFFQNKGRRNIIFSELFFDILGNEQQTKAQSLC